MYGTAVAQWCVSVCGMVRTSIECRPQIAPNSICYLVETGKQPSEWSKRRGAELDRPYRRAQHRPAGLLRYIFPPENETEGDVQRPGSHE
jgi:hypothetical protein